MTPASARSALDRQLAQVGQACVLQRLLGTALLPVGVVVRAHIVDFKPDELIAGTGLQAGDSKAHISTTQIDAVQWPGATPPSPGDPRVPRKGDRLFVQGKARTIIAAWEAPRIMGELVRIEMAVR